MTSIVPLVKSMDYWYAFKHIIQPDVLLREYVILKSATSGSMIITSTNSEMFQDTPFLNQTNVQIIMKH